jgi:hypothetical protein
MEKWKKYIYFNNSKKKWCLYVCDVLEGQAVPEELMVSQLCVTFQSSIDFLYCNWNV